MSGTLVSCIIVNFNGQATIAACIDSLLNQSRPPDEILVLDNHSSDDSPRFIRHRFPTVRFTALERNLGYAGACNRGFEQTQGEIVAFLNNDLVLDGQWLESILHYNRDPWSFWASRIMFHDPPYPIDSAGDGMAVVGTAYKRGHGQDPRDFETPMEIFGPCGAAAVYRRELLEAVGGFDERFFLIYEDADLNLRARLKGYRCCFVPEARVRHRVNQSIGSFSETYVYYGHRNSEFVFWKNFPAPFLLLYLPERIAFDLLSFAYFAAYGRGGAFLKAKADFVRGLPALWRSRRGVQRGRTLSLREFHALLDRNWFRYRRKIKKA